MLTSTLLFLTEHHIFMRKHLCLKHVGILYKFRLNGLEVGNQILALHSGCPIK